MDHLSLGRLVYRGLVVGQQFFRFFCLSAGHKPPYLPPPISDRASSQIIPRTPLVVLA